MHEMLPVNRSKAQARRFYDQISRIYDTLTASEKHLIRQGVELLSVRPGDRVLEVGCGTGEALTFITTRVTSEGSALGLDLSRKMLLKSRSKSTTPAYVQGDGACLPLQSSSFDAVFSAFTLELFSKADINTVLSECSRVLTPGGRLGLVTLTGEPRTLALRLYELAHSLFPVAVDCRPIPLEKLLTQNGFLILAVNQTRMWGLPVTLVLGAKPRPVREQ